jgi:hypothetical protein
MPSQAPAGVQLESIPEEVGPGAAPDFDLCGTARITGCATAATGVEHASDADEEPGAKDVTSAPAMSGGISESAPGGDSAGVR